MTWPSLIFYPLLFLIQLLPTDTLVGEKEIHIWTHVTVKMGFTLLLNSHYPAPTPPGPLVAHPACIPAHPLQKLSRPKRSKAPENSLCNVKPVAPLQFPVSVFPSPRDSLYSSASRFAFSRPTTFKSYYGIYLPN